MARLNFPSNFLLQRILFKAILAKDTADGVASAIRPFLTEEEIVLADDAADGIEADGFETTRSKKSKDSEENRELRDKLFDPVLSNLRGSIQYLKKLYRKTPHKLGSWGVTVDGAGKVVIPASFLDQVTLFTTFKAKHDGFAVGTSPLVPYLTESEIDMDDDETNVTDAGTAHTNFTTNATDSEEARQNRDNKWLPVVDHMHGIGAFLMNLYSAASKKTGQWGFVVDDSPRKPVLRTSKIKLGTTKTISGVVIGSSITNTGETNLKIFKGSTTDGTATELLPNTEFGVVAGYSTTTVANESSTKTGEFTYSVNR